MNKQPHILIIEDESLISGALKAKCTLEGFQTAVANNGQEGLVRALADHPDLILLDIIMPKMDGMTMLAKLREDEWGKSVPVILWTNLDESGQSEVQQMYNFIGAEGLLEQRPTVDYLVKSNNTPDQVVAKIKQKLGLPANK